MIDIELPGVRLIQGDCLERLKSLSPESVGMILTDPPYGMSFQSNHRSEKHKRTANDDGLDWLDAFAAECYRLAMDDTAHYIFCSWHHIEVFKSVFQRYFKVKNILIWEKNNTGMGDLKADFAPKHELILFLQKGRKEINGRRDSNIVKFARTQNALHPTQKPVDLCAYLISKFTNGGGSTRSVHGVGYNGSSRVTSRFALRGGRARPGLLPTSILSYRERASV